MAKCPDCDGLRYREYEAGLIRLRCETCKGKGEIKDDTGIDSGDRQDNSINKVQAPRKPRKRKESKARKAA